MSRRLRWASPKSAHAGWNLLRRAAGTKVPPDGGAVPGEQVQVACAGYGLVQPDPHPDRRCPGAAGVMEGEFHRHKHDQQDEFFFVLDGLFRIELDGADTVELGPRQAFTVPAGMLHRPVVPARSVVPMMEKAGVIATGG